MAFEIFELDSGGVGDTGPERIPGFVGFVCSSYYDYRAASGFRVSVSKPSGTGMWEDTVYTPVVTVVDSGYINTYAITGTVDFVTHNPYFIIERLISGGDLYIEYPTWEAYCTGYSAMPSGAYNLVQDETVTGLSGDEVTQLLYKHCGLHNLRYRDGAAPYIMEYNISGFTS